MGYAIGWAIGMVIYFGIRAYTSEMYTSEWCAKKLSRDKPYERLQGGYIIYANKTRWFYWNFAGTKLQWIPFSEGNDLDKLIEKESVEYQCTWLSDARMFNDVKIIINIHPNLEPPNLYWRIIKFLNN